MTRRVSILLTLCLALGCACDEEAYSDLRYLEQGYVVEEPGVLDGGSDLATSTLRAKAEVGTRWCPVARGGVRVVAQEVKQGAALVFTAEPGGEEALRARVLHMAEMHNRHHGSGQAGEPGAGGGWHWASVGLPAAVAVAEDVEAGARIVFHAQHRAEVGQLRERLPGVAARMETGECPWMGEEGPGSPSGQ